MSDKCSYRLVFDVCVFQGNLFGGLDDSLLARAEALAAADISKPGSSPHHMTGVKPDHGMYGPHSTAMDMPGAQHPATSRSVSQMPLHGFGAPGESMLDQLSGVSMPLSGMTADHSCVSSSSIPHSSISHTPQMYSPAYSHPGTASGMNHGHHGPHLASHHPSAAAMHGGPPGGPHPAMHPHHDLDCDPRELEAFAEHFKQRRIKLGVTQADVGNALGKLKLPGVGSLSQSTICRFESLTLSHNNMVALKPVLLAWLEEAEKSARDAKAAGGDIFSQNGDRKRKRTSIAAPEKRSLEAYFTIQPRPSGEKIAQIAEKLDLKKNVVRVWFCNQRQKQKRMKFAAVVQPGMASH